MRICRASLTAAMSRHSFRDGNNNEKHCHKLLSSGCHMSPWFRIFGVTQTAWKLPEPTGFDGTCFRTKILGNYSAPKKLTVRLAKGEACVFQPLLFRGHSLVWRECIWNTSGCVRYIFEAIGIGIQLWGILSGHFLEWSIADRPCFPSEMITCVYTDTICKYTVYTCVFIAVCFFHFVIEEVHLRWWSMFHCCAFLSGCLSHLIEWEPRSLTDRSGTIHVFILYP